MMMIYDDRRSIFDEILILNFNESRAMERGYIQMMLDIREAARGICGMR